MRFIRTARGPASPRTLFLAGLILYLSGCDTAGTQTLTRLYFGMSSQGLEIPAAQWNGFVDSVITPLFPGGFTVYAANGQWRNVDGSIAKEKCMVLEIIHPRDAGTDRNISEIAETYKKRFNQESVLVLRHAAKAAF